MFSKIGLEKNLQFVKNLDVFSFFELDFKVIFAQKIKKNKFLKMTCKSRKLRVLHSKKC